MTSRKRRKHAIRRKRVPARQLFLGPGEHRVYVTTRTVEDDAVLKAVRSVMGRKTHSDGSGYDFTTGSRDMDFSIPTLRQAIRVVRALQAICGVRVALYGPIKVPRVKAP